MFYYVNSRSKLKDFIPCYSREKLHLLIYFVLVLTIPWMCYLTIKGILGSCESFCLLPEFFCFWEKVKFFIFFYWVVSFVVGSLWVVVGRCGIVVGRCGIAVDRCGSLWDRCGSLWVVVGSLWIVVDRCGSLWDRCGSLWIVVGRCGSLWVVVGRCGSLWVVPGFSNYERIKGKEDCDVTVVLSINKQTNTSIVAFHKTK